MPPLTVLRLKKRISTLERELSLVQKQKSDLLKKIDSLSKYLEKQSQLLAADKRSLVPVVHLNLKILTVTPGTNTNLTKSRRQQNRTNINKPFYIDHEMDDEDSSKTLIKIEEESPESGGDESPGDDDYFPPEDYQSEPDSSNPSSPAVTVAQNDNVIKANKQKLGSLPVTEHRSKTIRRIRKTFLRRSKNSNKKAFGSRKPGVNIRRKLTSKSIGSEKLNRPLTRMEEFIVSTLDEIAQAPIPKRKKILNKADFVVPKKLESFAVCFQKKISSFIEEAVKENEEIVSGNPKSVKTLTILPVVSRSKKLGIVDDDRSGSNIVIPSEEAAEIENSEKIDIAAKPKFECSVCNKILRSAATLKIHMLDHEGTKPFSCNICGKSYVVEPTLRRHKLIHEKKKKKCTKCEKSFTTNEDLNKHNRFMHEKEYRFKCSMCPKQFVDSSGFRRHERRHLGIKPHLCSECGRSFPELANLRLHMNSQHSGKDKPFRVKVVI